MTEDAERSSRIALDNDSCHDLRSPLAAIFCFAELLVDEISGPLNKEQQEEVAAILENCHRLNAMIDSLQE